MNDVMTSEIVNKIWHINNKFRKKKKDKRKKPMNRKDASTKLQRIYTCFYQLRAKGEVNQRHPPPHVPGPQC